jgi:4-diphosphocytidyl-2C-methyl-D-erythritol kinase
MSGSGSTLFGIFAHHPGDLRSEFPADSELMVCQARV